MARQKDAQKPENNPRVAFFETSPCTDFAPAADQPIQLHRPPGAGGRGAKS